jgi:hypothetical protein
VSQTAHRAWPPAALALTGAWLLAAPATFGYADEAIAPSDWASGAALLLLAGVMQWARRDGTAAGAQWAASLVGTWLLFAPLAFWAPASSYIVSIGAGTAAIVFSILLPRAPLERDFSGPDIPPGWNYNPSSMAQRAPIIVFAFLGFFIAQYMAAYQLGYHNTPWDPFFGDGTRRVLTSDVSKAFPVSDAGLGAFAYLVEALTGFVGGPRRWRTMPWMVLLFGVMVVPAGIVAIVLIVLQPVAVGAWCSLCLLTGLLTLLMISPAADEMVATLQFLGNARRTGRGFWRTLWRGGAGDQAQDDSAAAPTENPSWIATAMGVGTVTPTLIACAVLGIWLMASPALLGAARAAADSSRVIGPLVITFSVVALADVARTTRWLNLPLGAWVAAAPWFLDGASNAGRWHDMAAGFLLVALSIPRGRIRDRFGSFNRYIV